MTRISETVCLKAVRVFRAHLQGHFPPARPLQTLQRKSQAVQGQVLCQSKRRRGLGSNSRQAERTSQRRQMHHNTQGNLVWLLLRPFDITIRKQVVTYHWRALSQVSFLSRQSFFRDKRRVLSRKKVCLSRQNYVCRDKRFVTTNMSRQNTSFVFFVATEHVFCREKIMQVPFLSRRKCVCRDKIMFVGTNFCRDKRRVLS